MANEQFKVIAGIDTHADTHYLGLRVIPTAMEEAQVRLFSRGFLST